MAKRKVAVVTGSRAEYGILRPLLNRLTSSPDFELALMVTGLHLLPEFGKTIALIEEDGFPMKSIIEMYDESADSKKYYGQALARGIKGFTEELDRIGPDFVVVLGDRLEPFAATLSGAFLHIPIVHLHGGDRTDAGLFDESIRHSISRFASIHLVALSEHADRLVKMGEDSSRIHVVGSMGLDTIVNINAAPREIISERISFDIDDQTLLLIFHPESIGVDIRSQIVGICNAIRELKLKTIILYPNNDPGNEIIIDEIEKMQNLDFVKIIKSLPHDDYIDVLKNIAVLIGNSSSGIIEAASVQLPVVNIDSRQKARVTGPNVLNVSSKTHRVVEAIKKALYDEKFRQSLQDIKNPYGDGHTAERIIEILRNVKIEGNLVKKTITY